MNKGQGNSTNQESSGADKVGVANSGQNQFPLKKDAQQDTEQQNKQDGPASAGSQVRDEAKQVNSGRHDSNQGNQ
ncbi:hypothetical protein [Hymenobacter latericus]|uniref:hypothetical protein n=1 Tax=Hymenobacter sp. YIM 151858-1 TaxID=2987688 RepID=UPI0022268086|nr:hypothetical protein [Hymenobacter sp. YIM 151858-1]UYZ59375.1 hypothetical protein OIS50_00910 [Hymenobacter sp. YIM 151858-1]